MSKASRIVVLPAFLLGIPSCSDDTTAAPPPNTVVMPESDAATDARGSDPPPLPEAGTPGVEPLYLIDARISQPDFTATEYLTLAKNLDSGEIGTTGSLEQPGYSRLYADAKTGYFVIGNGETKRMTRYDISDDGKFVPGAILSFEGVGVTRFAFRAVDFISPEKAYYRNLDAAQIVVWNPKTMALTGTIIAIDGLLRAGRTPFLQTPARVGKYIFAGIGWVTNDSTAVDPDGALLRIDTETDVATLVPETRCVVDGRNVVMPDGATYFFSEAYHYFFRGSGIKGCALRIAKGADSFDPSFLLDVSQRAGGKIASGYAAANGGNLWLSVRDVPPEGTSPQDGFGTGWQWATFDPTGAASPTIDTTLAPSSAGGNVIAFDNRRFVSVSTANSPNTALFEITSGKFVTRATVLTNAVQEIARIK